MDKPIKRLNRHALGPGCLEFAQPMQLTQKKSQSKENILPLVPGSQSGITKQFIHIPCCMCKISCRLILSFGCGSDQHLNIVIKVSGLDQEWAMVLYIVCVRKLKDLKYREIQTDDVFKRHCSFLYSQ